MPKRKRECGSYVDEETGEVTTVQTTKQAKRNHQKSGKWYKEPTAKELRIWEREAQQKEQAEKAIQREKNRKKNAAKRAEKEARELELKRQEFNAGKITFTQTLAKKDEDQLNLHSWFGGKPQKSKPAQSLSKTAQINAEDKENEEQVEAEVQSDSETAHGCHFKDSVTKLSQKSVENEVSLSNTSSHLKHLRESLNVSQPDMAEDQALLDLLQEDDLQMSQAFEDFDIAEDVDVEQNEEGDNLAQSQSATHAAEHEFRIPALPIGPKRLPLSPMSKSEINIRNSQTQNVSSFKAKLAQSGLSSMHPAGAVNMPSTQIVKSLLSGLCTQDLDDDDLDEDQPDKENESPFEAMSSEKEVDTLKKRSLFAADETSVNKSPTKSKPSFQCATSLNDSFNGTEYDSIFAELDESLNDSHTKHDDFDDDGLDDDTLLSLPATQILLSMTKTPSQTTTTKLPLEAHMKPNHSQPEIIGMIQPCDSFAVDGLSDQDLLQGLAEYERSTSKIEKKRKRTLPWNRPGWITETSGGSDSQEMEDMAEDFADFSQRTEILSQRD